MPKPNQTLLSCLALPLSFLLHPLSPSRPRPSRLPCCWNVCTRLTRTLLPLCRWNGAGLCDVKVKAPRRTPGLKQWTWRPTPQYCGRPFCLRQTEKRTCAKSIATFKKTSHALKKHRITDGKTRCGTTCPFTNNLSASPHAKASDGGRCPTRSPKVLLAFGRS